MTNTKKLDRLVSNKDYGYKDELNYRVDYKFIQDNFDAQYARAIRCKEERTPRGFLIRTHNIELFDNYVVVENSNSGEYEIEFDSNEEAKKYWEQNFKTEIFFK